MTKKTLQNWYYSDDISYSEKERLSKIGVSDYNEYYLQDLKQILRCENWAKENWKIRSEFTGRISRIIFFTPNFNDSKPDASNYSCAIVRDGDYKDWVIVYRPSYLSNIESDLVVEKVDNASDAESELNGSYPISAVASFSASFYIREKKLSSDAKNNPDRYILPLDIVKRPIDKTKYHFGIYLGNKWVAHLAGKGEGTEFSSWNNFHSPNNRGGISRSSSSSSSSFSNSSSGIGAITVYHPRMPFKRKGDIIRHTAKAISYEYGKYSYSWNDNNCEHLANGCVLGLNVSKQVENIDSVIQFPLFSGAARHINNFINILKDRMKTENERLDNLTSSYYSEKERIERYIREAENNHSYNRSKYQIEQEKFEERIEVYPKDWCRVS